jgi:hypothetical protein
MVFMIPHFVIPEWKNRTNSMQSAVFEVQEIQELARSRKGQQRKMPGRSIRRLDLRSRDIVHGCPEQCS